MDLNKLAAAALSLACSAASQVQPVVPFSRTLDLLVVDSTFDGIWRLTDFNQDGDYDDAGEVIVFYSDLTSGGVTLGNPSCIVCGPDGTAYIADGTNDVVLALRDQNADGDANDAGEFRVFFTSITNASGITMASAQGITIDAMGRVFVAVANAGTVGQDIILRLQDLDADGDADDQGEATVYCQIPTGSGSVGNSIPTKVVAAADGNLYYTDVGSTGVTTKGVYKLADLDFDGDCNDPGEVSLFWTPPFTASPFYWSLAVDWNLNFYVTDHSANRAVYRGRDVDNNGMIDANEATLFFTETAATWWDIVLREDGAVLLLNANTTDRITACVDLDVDGDALDPNETTSIYSSVVSPTPIGLRGAAFLRAPKLELGPATVQVGQTTTLVTTAARPGDLVVTALSTGLVPAFSLPPWGKLEIDAGALIVLGFGIADPNAIYALPLPIPSTLAAPVTLGVQSLSGDNHRLFLTNGALLTVTP